MSWLPSLLIGRGLARPDAALVQVAFNLFGAMGSIAAGLLPAQVLLALIPVLAVSGLAALFLARKTPVGD